MLPLLCISFLEKVNNRILLDKVDNQIKLDDDLTNELDKYISLYVLRDNMDKPYSMPRYISPRS